MAGQTLSSSTGGWSGVSLSYAYQWKRCDLSGNGCTGISGATGSTYNLGASEVGTTLRVDVTASNKNGSATATSAQSAVVAPAPASPAPSNTALPQVSGTAQLGQTLTGSNGSWNGSPTSYAYQWKRCDTAGANCAAIAGATASTYALASADTGATVRFTVTATNSSGSTSATSAATAVVTALTAPTNTAAPSISGTMQVSQLLTGSTGSWNGSPTSYGYQWRRCDSTGGTCADISGATAKTYTLQSADLSKTLRVVVTATNSVGSAAATSAATAAITSSSSSLTGSAMFGISDGGDLVWEADATRQRELDSMKAMGAKWIRYDFSWSGIEATKGTFNFTQTDLAVKEAAARGMSVIAILAYAPAWANGGYTDNKYPPTNPADYANFAKAVATHFGPLGVHVYELWNEPNISVFWKPTPNVAKYAALVKAAYPAIHAGDPNAVVLAGATSPHGAYHDSNCDGVADSGYDSTGYDPLDFLLGMYANGAGGYFDALSHHPYERAGFPTHPCSAWYQMAQSTPSLRSIMTANGDSAKKIWATEYGNEVPQWTDEAGQASRLTTAMTAWKTFPWAGPMMAFNLWDTHGSYFAMLRSDWTQRPAWFAFQTQATS
jgi:Cellulase (glycosyl hydrolase family 5)